MAVRLPEAIGFLAKAVLNIITQNRLDLFEATGDASFRDQIRERVIQQIKAAEAEPPACVAPVHPGALEPVS